MVPMKTYWMGEDIEMLPREKLIEIIQDLGQQIDQQRKMTHSVIEISNMARRARERQVA